MPDDRPLQEKLEAMAAQTASPEEAEVARAMLARLPRPAQPGESRRVLTRERIMSAPDRDSLPRTVRWKDRYGRWIEADLDLFELDEEGHLTYKG